MEMLAGETVRMKSGWATTVSATVVVWLIPPPSAATVTVETPAVAVAPAEKVRVEVPDPGAENDAGLKTAVTPEGSPVTESPTSELKPPTAVAVIGVVAECPSLTVTLAGAALKIKSGTGVPTDPSMTDSVLLAMLDT